MEREYPHLKFRTQWSLSPTIMFLLGKCDALVQSILNTPILPNHYSKLMRVSLIKGAQSTTAIEGNTLTEEDIENLLEGEKMPPSKEYQEKEVRNVINALNELMHEVVDNDNVSLITPELLLRFHGMIGKGLEDHFDAIPGRFRENNVTVGRYRCPDHNDVPELVGKLCTWLKEEFSFQKGQQEFFDVLIQSIVTHIYIEWIHPFGDGNGRTGRLVEFYILLRGGNPNLASHILSNHYNLTRPHYYRQIEQATASGDLTKFIEYALQGFHDGLNETLKVIQKSQFEITWKKLVYDTFNDVPITQKEVFKRQRNLALELPLEGSFKLDQIPDLSIPLAKTYGAMSSRSLHRDIDVLVELDLVEKAGKLYTVKCGQLTGMMARNRRKKTVSINI